MKEKNRFFYDVKCGDDGDDGSKEKWERMEKKHIQLPTVGCAFVAFPDEKKKETKRRRVTICTRPAPTGLIRLEPVVFNCWLDFGSFASSCSGYAQRRLTRNNGKHFFCLFCFVVLLFSFFPRPVFIWYCPMGSGWLFLFFSFGRESAWVRQEVTGSRECWFSAKRETQ